MKIIGIGGTNGSGKDTLAQLIADNYGYLFISGSDILRQELKKRGLPIERHNLRELSAEWRRQFGRGVLVDKAVDLYKQEQHQYKGLVVVSLRNPGEAEAVHKLGGQVVWIDADPKLRYKRIYSRQRGTEDQKTFEQFLAEEQVEMQHSGDENTLNMAAVKEQADIFITNDTDSLEEFKDIAKKKLGL